MWFCQQPKNAKNREINKTYPENNIPSVFKHLTYIGSITQDRKSPKAMYHLRFSTLDSANSFQRCWCRFKTRNGQSHMYGPGVQLVAWRRIKREKEKTQGEREVQQPDRSPSVQTCTATRTDFHHPLVNPYWTSYLLPRQHTTFFLITLFYVLSSPQVSVDILPIPIIIQPWHLHLCCVHADRD